jgi:uncharacterized protein YceH (UPF0502 family)
MSSPVKLMVNVVGTIEGQVVGFYIKESKNIKTGEVYPNTLRMVLLGNKYQKLNQNTDVKVNGLEVSEKTVEELIKKYEGKRVSSSCAVFNVNKPNESVSVEAKDITVL